MPEPTGSNKSATKKLDAGVLLTPPGRGGWKVTLLYQEDLCVSGSVWY